MAGIRMGKFNIPSDNIGDGPGGGSSPYYKSIVYLPTRVDVVADITEARAKGITLVTNFAGSRNTWTDELIIGTTKFRIYRPDFYERNLRYWTVAGGSSAEVAEAIEDALADRTMIVYAVDEPKHPTFNNSISLTQVNAMGLLSKLIWPGSIVAVRANGTVLAGAGTPTGGYTGVDYGWAQYEGPHSESNGKMPAVYFAEQEALLAALDLGMIAGMNFLDGGIYNNLGTIQACWQTGLGFGLLKGTFSGTLPMATFVGCGARPSNETRFAINPDLMAAVADAIYNNPNVPLLLLWTYILPLPNGDYTAFTNYAALTAIVNAEKAMITKLDTRAVDNGWRTAKGAAPPPAAIALEFIGATAFAANTGTLHPDVEAGDLVLAFAAQTGAAITPSLAGGYTSVIGGNTGSLVGTRMGWKVAASSGELAGTFNNAQAVIFLVYRHQLGALPIGTIASISNTNSATVNYPANIPQVGDGTSWFITFAAHSGATDIGTVVPIDTILRATIGKLAVWGSNGGKATWAQKSVILNALGAYRAHTIEIKVDPTAPEPEVNDPPVLDAVGNKTVEAEQLLNFTVTAADPEDDEIQFSFLPGANPVPAGMVIDSVSGEVDFTPTRLQVGQYNIVVRATDIEGTNPSFPYDEESITITVTAIPQDPGPDPDPEPLYTLPVVAAQTLVDLEALDAILDNLREIGQLNASDMSRLLALDVLVAETIAYVQTVIDAQEDE